MKNLLISLSILALFHSYAHAEIIKLWKDNVPFSSEPKAPEIITEKRKGQWRVTKVTDPHLKLFPSTPDKHNGISLIICPGGAYKHLNHLDAGKAIAEYFNTKGFTCFVLYYQVPDNRTGALSDAMRAVKIIRSRAKEWKLKPDQIGMIGSSAGANLIVNTSIQTQDLSARPSFAVLLSTAYLAEKGKTQLLPQYTNLPNPPPFFLAVAANDKTWVLGSKLFAQQLTKENLTNQLHVFDTGGHSFGVDPDNPAGKAWPPLFLNWLEELTN